MSNPPLPIRVNHNEKIVLSDGTVLSALTWMPAQADADPVPAILEYLPYRKRDSTAHRDALNHGYLAAHGYACVRVDMRGSGDSEGLLKGEYLQQEQDDALEILKWIAAQTWCSGSIGMMGISWGGFNALQVAALRPPELKAIITVCSTDDRHDNDVHYMGGCQLVENFHWGAVMFTVSPTPPDPALVGDKWRKMWLDRLEYGVPYVAEWHEHQRRDDFWKHASICEDYGAIQCPVYLVGGWQDPYHNSIFRMMEHLKCPKKALIGPWGHKYPNMAVPEPVGFLQESLRWWDKWLKGIETNIMDEPKFRFYQQSSNPPKRHFNSPVPGRWIAENIWPSPRVATRLMGLEPKRLVNKVSCSDAKLSFCSPQTVGFGTGRWIPYGLEADLPGDQLEDARASLTFDTQPLTEPLDIFGAPLLRLRVASDKPNALVAAVISEILPDGSAARITYGVLDLTHRDSHTDLKTVEPHRFYDVTVRLNESCQRIGTGSVIRLALSTSYFPTVWPSPEAATLTVDCASSSLELPTRPANPLDDKLRPFEPAVNGAPLKAIHLREGKSKNTITEDLDSGEKTATYYSDTGLYEIEETGWRFAERAEVISKIKPDDPLSGLAQQNFRLEYGRSGLDLAIEGVATMTASATKWLLNFQIEAFENGERIFEKDWKYNISRDHN
ncbi:Alpha/Beta hydrolase protein [Annulohypoxylon nitens]|nr:Alpha/Beta hydrolase protein [Annulohypoxylon nitens]